MNLIFLILYGSLLNHIALLDATFPFLQFICADIEKVSLNGCINYVMLLPTHFKWLLPNHYKCSYSYVNIQDSAQFGLLNFFSAELCNF